MICHYYFSLFRRDTQITKGVSAMTFKRKESTTKKKFKKRKLLWLILPFTLVISILLFGRYPLIWRSKEPYTRFHAPEKHLKEVENRVKTY